MTGHGAGSCFASPFNTSTDRRAAATVAQRTAARLYYPIILLHPHTCHFPRATAPPPRPRRSRRDAHLACLSTAFFPTVCFCSDERPTISMVGAHQTRAHSTHLLSTNLSLSSSSSCWRQRRRAGSLACHASVTFSLLPVSPAFLLLQYALRQPPAATVSFYLLPLIISMAAGCRHGGSWAAGRRSIPAAGVLCAINTCRRLIHLCPLPHSASPRYPALRIPLGHGGSRRAETAASPASISAKTTTKFAYRCRMRRTATCSAYSVTMRKHHVAPALRHCFLPVFYRTFVTAAQRRRTARCTRCRSMALHARCCWLPPWHCAAACLAGASRCGALLAAAHALRTARICCRRCAHAAAENDNAVNGVTASCCCRCFLCAARVCCALPAAAGMESEKRRPGACMSNKPLPR